MTHAIDSIHDTDEAHLSSGSKRVLWVDDDPNLAAGFARRLRPHGIEIIHAYDGMQGYWMAASQKPDMVITDLRMPNWPGNELVECLSLNRQLSRIPTIVISGHLTAADTRQLQEIGVSAVLEKPVSLEDLLIELKQLT